eukprot:GHVO01054737.1.p1 GENE.GHVO01054737.1~~GHVO01054737.1.p1  ORF type:complete len:101 (-),score=4.72 GHVO01054737.1:262-564(-)
MVNHNAPFFSRRPRASLVRQDAHAESFLWFPVHHECDGRSDEPAQHESGHGEHRPRRCVASPAGRVPTTLPPYQGGHVRRIPLKEAAGESCKRDGVEGVC